MVPLGVTELTPLPTPPQPVDWDAFLFPAERRPSFWESFYGPPEWPETGRTHAQLKAQQERLIQRLRGMLSDVRAMSTQRENADRQPSEEPTEPAQVSPPPSLSAPEQCFLRIWKIC